MKPWFALSLILNVTLVAFLAPNLRPTRLNHAATISVGGRANDIVSHPYSTAVAASSVDAARGSDWHAWLGQLRASGVPNKILAGLVVSDFESHWEEQQRELQRRYENGEVGPEALTQSISRHDDDQERELRAALGDEGYLRWDRERTLRELRLTETSLAPGQAEAIYELRKTLLTDRRRIEQARQRGEIDPMDADNQLVAVQSQYQKAFEQAVGPDHANATRAEPDFAAVKLRQELRGLEVPVAQFAALTAAQRAADQQLAALDRAIDQSGAAANYDSSRARILASREEAFRQTLGEAGYVEYLKNQSDEYRTMTHFAPAWQLQPAEIDHVYNTMNAYARRVGDYYQALVVADQRGEPVDWSSAEQRVREISTQTEEALKHALGPTRFDQLKRGSVIRFAGEPLSDR
jgi:hypothetical protein